MDRYETLEQLTKSLNAAGRIHRLLSSHLREEAGSYARPDLLAVANEILKVIAENSPGRKREALERAINEGNAYSNAYRDLRHHVSAIRSRRNDIRSWIKAFEALKPILGHEQRILIEKISKIYEILIS